MFKKLKWKFILTNLATSTAVLLIAFSSIYLVAASSASHRIIEPFRARTEQFIQQITNKDKQPAENATESRPTPESQPEDNELTEEDMNEEIDKRVTAEREASLSGLLISLIVTGAAMEVLVFLISIYLAEQSIKPVRDAYLAQKAFVANASHEIKTPLAVIQANLEAADIHDNHWIDNVEKKVDDLARLNQQLLTLARMDSAKPEIELKEVDLTEITRETVDFYRPKMAENGIKLSLKTPKTLKITINEPEYVQILNILVDNAVKYCAKKIDINLTNKSISVKNDGTTIEKDDLKHIFERFYQTDKSSSGVGLGLAIAKQVADSNSWHLKTASDEKSTAFTLEFK